MKEIPTKQDNVGDTLSADEFNPNSDELENSVTASGQTLNEANANQLGEAIAKYSSGGGNFYNDTGSANSYVLSGIDNFRHPTVYFDGMEAIAAANASNTGASDINVNGIGVKNLKDSNGDDLAGNVIVINRIFSARYNLAADQFRLITGASLLIAPLNTNGFSINESQGAPVVSATQPNIWAQDGNTLHITGVNQIDDFTDAPRIGAKVTLIFDAALLLKDGLGITLPGGADILTAAGDRFEVYADAVNAFSGTFIKNVSPSSFATQFLHIEDHKSSGTQGGTFTSGAYRLRDLNTVLTNQIEGSSLSANVISVPAGTYYIEASAPAYQVNDHKLKLQDNTAVTDLIIGSTERVSQADGTQSRSFVSGQFSVSVTTNLRLLHRCEVTNAGDGFGTPSSFGDIEVYTQVKIWRIGA